MYIKDLTCISPQKSFNNELFTVGVEKIVGIRYNAIDPDYMDIIPHNLLRRMGRVVKLGIGTGLTLVKKHNNLNGIIIGTSNGGLEDCFKFLNQIIQYDEGTLTPTNFVQSTPSAVAGNLALMSQNTGYNVTHINGGLSFENVLLDTLELLKENTNASYLIGASEEISDYNFNINLKLDLYKLGETDNTTLLNDNTKGTVNGEGAAMFVVDNNPENAFAEILDTDQITFPNNLDIEFKLTELLKRNNLKYSDIDAIMVGRNGDVDDDKWYDEFEDKFPESYHLVFKNLCGEYQTASGFSTWLAAQILKGEKIPALIQRKSSDKSIKHLLIYNHYRGEQHGFILLCR
ncbi:beta-ketoacyl synthase chain length factor [Crocinitomix catalasitica]|uniref:beta-ketoacyl synthase chain length factor n=1 Tax=Crocinitomix catalasitica TaxID=184607 RepID=UPI0004814AF3|nr:beta-ketoacyl synthase chain length factor [Crocinitomix catalasitica]